jgi:hypothetical protein
MQSPQIWSNRLSYILAGLLLLALAAELGFFARRQSQTIDEADHIHAGYRYWQCADFGVNPEHPPLAKLVDTLPLVFDRPRNPGPPCASYGTGTSADFAHGHDFLYSNDAGRILAETRFFAASFTFLLALFVFAAARRMFGDGPAFLALLLLVFEPTVLAHGAEVTTDLPVTCWFFGAVYAFYRYTDNPTALRLILSGVATGLALVAKHSAAVLLLVLVLLAVADSWLRRRDSVSADSSGGSAKWMRLLVRRAAALAVIGFMATAILWGFYLFRYSARPAGHEMSDSLTTYIQDAIRYGGVHSVLLSQVIPRLVHVLPESYLYGLANVTIASSGGRQTFLLGQLYATGQWFYFPVAFAIKSTLAFLLLLLVTFAVAPYLWGEKKREMFFLTVPAAVFFGLSLTSRLNIGIRHILPIYPFLIVLAAGTAWRLASRKRAWMYIVVALAAFHCVSSLMAFPNYLSYSNEIWGGPQETYRFLSASNVDIGGGHIDERNYLARNQITDCWIAAFGSADLDYYGVPCKSFPGVSTFVSKRFAVVPSPVEGTLLISASQLAGVSWGPPELNPYSPLWHVKPVANLGGHTLVFQGRFDLPLLSAASHSTEAQILSSQGHMDEALAEAHAAVEMAPQRMEAHLTLAQVLTRAKQVPQARVEYSEAIRLGETGETGYYRIPIYAARKGLAALNSAR